jgi:hypothetical protein
MSFPLALSQRSQSVRGFTALADHEDESVFVDRQISIGPSIALQYGDSRGGHRDHSEAATNGQTSDVAV